MGSDKALLRLPDGRTAVEAVAAAARPAASRLLLAVDSPAHADALRAAMREPLELLLDPLPGEGPLITLAAALSRAAGPAVVLLAVDMPLVSSALIRALHETWIAEDGAGMHVVAPFVDGIVQPMPACYASALSGTADRLIRAGERSLRALLQAPAVRLCTLDEAALRRADPDLASMARADTPEAWERICARAGRRNTSP